MFTLSEDDLSTKETMCAGNDKEKQAILAKRTHIAGISWLVSNCGIVMDIYELLGSESTTQVWLNWLDFYSVVPEMEKVIRCHCYDNVRATPHCESRQSCFSLFSLLRLSSFVAFISRFVGLSGLPVATLCRTAPRIER